ncbi:diaminopimelate decarboxylase [Micromonospora pattaloongensis]|uniref:Diaminopimelate decarboxylase n=1 Tax=Micromonospora pattaloongensis TaxID=405436 RepID=A0A1H3JU90_9ACTN|nr:diaminopimelate decarboxylase [Micromonospora pattaloongensis]SDY43506.1 diaminopimelate decarboxylase [Micromonospora pattaloongensis]
MISIDTPALPYGANGLQPKLWSRHTVRRPDGVVTIGGVALTDLAEQYGTPAYVYDEAEFRLRCDEFRRAFHDFDVYYAGKSFLCRAVARWVAESGIGLDVCTEGELRLALSAGFPAERIVLHGNNKSAVELELAVEHHVGRIVVDSFDEIERLTTLAADRGVCPPVLVRATVGVRPDTHDNIATAHEDQKFGFSVASGAAADAVELIHAGGVLDLRGLHIHLGSQIFGTREYEFGIRCAVELLAELAKAGDELPELSLGGGFAIAYIPDQTALPVTELAERLRSAVGDACRAAGIRVPRLAVEPGRAISGPSGATVYRVGTIKHLPGLRTYIAVDGGMSDNIRPPLYDGVYVAVVAGRDVDGDDTPVRVVGRHCDAGDVVVRDDVLPSGVRLGDLLAVPGTGAYCRSLSNNFNHVPRPPVVAVLDGQARLIVRGETFDDLFGLDVG